MLQAALVGGLGFFFFFFRGWIFGTPPPTGLQSVNWVQWKAATVAGGGEQGEVRPTLLTPLLLFFFFFFFFSFFASDKLKR